MKGFLCLLLLCLSVSSLELTGPPVHTARLGSDARVPCPFTVDNPPVDPNHLTIFWYFRDKEVLSYDKTVRTTSPRYSLSTGVLVMGIANLIIFSIRIPDGGMYKCSVIYGLEKKEKEVRLDIGAPPQVTITNKMAVVNEESVLRCSVTGFYPMDIDIKWFKDGEELNNISTEDPQRNSDRTYSVKSAVTITPTEEDRARIFSCRVYQDFLQGSFQKDFCLVYEASPQVTITHKVVLNAKSFLRCSATGFFPPDIDIKWIRDGKQLEDNIFIGDPWRNPNRTYSVNSTVTITPTEEDREQNFSCRVHHKSLQEPLQEDFHLVYEDRSLAWIMAVCFVPVVILIIIIAVVLWWRLKWRKAPLIICDIVGPPKLIDGEEAVLCYTVDDAPEDLCVTWLIRRVGQEQEIQTSQRREHSEEEESLLDTSYVIKSKVVGRQYSSSLSFIPHMERHKGVTFICRGVSGKHKGERTFSCETIYGKPQMSAPIEITMADSSHVQFSLKLQKFYPKDIKISWRWENASENYGNRPDIKTIGAQNDDLTYEVTSIIRIPNSLFKNPEKKFIVEWNHESMETSETRSLSVRDFPWRPHVGFINVPELKNGKAATLTCEISRYFSDLLSVNWFIKKDGNVTALPRTSAFYMNRTYKISYKEEIQADSTYSCDASLTFTPIINSHQGSEIIFRVEHPSEERPIERSTAPLHINVKNQNSGQSRKQLIGSKIQNTIQLLGNLSIWKEKALTPGSKNNEVD